MNRTTRFFRSVLPFALALSPGLAACSGSESQGSENDHDHAPRAGLRLGLNPSFAPGFNDRSCPTGISISSWKLGNPPPTGSDPGTPLADGDGIEVSCRISGDGTFSAHIVGADASRATSPDLTLEASGTAAVDALADVMIDTAATLELRSDPVSAPCAVASHSDLASGDLILSLSCPAIIDPARPSFACSAGIDLVLGSCDE